VRAGRTVMSVGYCEEFAFLGR